VIDNDAVITIEDDGVGISKNKLKSLLNSRKANSYESESTSIGMGICNLNDRMISYYGEEYKIEIESKENIGTKVKIKIPIL
jgi:sensor histidine kinase YesM